MTNLQHAVGFLQTAYTVILVLAVGEAFKQFVPDNDKVRIERLPSLLAFLFLIFPFFHGMSRYFYKAYISNSALSEYWAGFLMGDGIAFLVMAACFFVMSRSLDPSQWRRYYAFLAGLLLVDSIWIAVGILRDVKIGPWLVLNCVLATIIFFAYRRYRRSKKSVMPMRICAATTFLTTAISYVWMKDFYFT